jgi:HEPN domain-containing protein
MKELPELLHLVQQWVERAEEDLRNAEHTLTLQEDCPLSTVCFHSQQCVEKYLKALLTYCSVPFPKTHDLIQLLNLIPVDHRLDLAPADLVVVNRYAIEGRYPGDWEKITRRETEEAVEMARDAREKIRVLLPESTRRKKK